MSSNYYVTFDEIYAEWDKDCVIDKGNLEGESLKIGELKIKYWKFLRMAKQDIASLVSQQKRLKLEKYEFYTKGPAKEKAPKGWRQAAQGTLNKGEAENYLDADPDVLAMNEQVAKAENIIAFLNDIIRTINDRSFHIKNTLEIERFKAGLN